MLTQDPTPTEIMTAIEAWCDLLADQNYEAAFAYTEHDPYYQWTPDLIRRVIEGYGLPEPYEDGRTYRVTPRMTAKLKPGMAKISSPQITCVFQEDIIARACYDLPLNGEWSDLTATFRIERQADHAVMILEEIHVF